MYIKYTEPKSVIVFWIISNLWNIITEPTWSIMTSNVHPIITPNIVGIVFLIPKLNAVYEVIILFGPGDREATKLKSTNENNCEDILSDI